ncbi:MAG: MotE family protein [Nitrospiria bacterium]
MKALHVRQIILSIMGILFLLFVKPLPLLTQSQPLKEGKFKEVQPPSKSETPTSMIEAIQQRNADIDKKSKALEAKEQRLQIMEKEISNMIKKHTRILETITQKEAQKKSKLELEQEERYRRISKIYEKMPAEDAATRIDKMKEAFALNLLRVIKPKSVAQILVGLSPAKAAKLSEKLSRKPR